MNKAIAILGEIHKYASEIGEDSMLINCREVARDEIGRHSTAEDLRYHVRRWRENITMIAELLDQLETLK
jgi:hypothetical protein